MTIQELRALLTTLTEFNVAVFEGMGVSLTLRQKEQDVAFPKTNDSGTIGPDGLTPQQQEDLYGRVMDRKAE